MRDKKLSIEESWKISLMDKPEIPNSISGDTIMVYKLYCSLLVQVVRLDMEVEALKAKK